MAKHTHTHTHTLIICNTYYLSKAAMVTRTRVMRTLSALSCTFCCTIKKAQKPHPKRKTVYFFLLVSNEWRERGIKINMDEVQFPFIVHKRNYTSKPANQQYRKSIQLSTYCAFSALRLGLCKRTAHKIYRVRRSSQRVRPSTDTTNSAATDAQFP